MFCGCLLVMKLEQHESLKKQMVQHLHKNGRIIIIIILVISDA
jgi:hypothetical protein